MRAKRMIEYEVPVTISEKRIVRVRAHSPDHAKQRVSEGKYDRIGKPYDRGFLIIDRGQIATPKP